VTIHPTIYNIYFTSSKGNTNEERRQERERRILEAEKSYSLWKLLENEKHIPW